MPSREEESHIFFSPTVKLERLFRCSPERHYFSAPDWPSGRRETIPVCSPLAYHQLRLKLRAKMAVFFFSGADCQDLWVVWREKGGCVALDNGFIFTRCHPVSVGPEVTIDEEIEESGSSLLPHKTCCGQGKTLDVDREGAVFLTLVLCFRYIVWNWAELKLYCNV